MNLLDVLLLVLLATSALAGWRTGLLLRASSWIGLVGGLLLSPLVIPEVLDRVAPPSAQGRLLVVIATFLLTIGVTSAVAQVVGLRLRRAVADTPLRGLDHLGGLAAGVLGVLVSVWLLAPLAGVVPGVAARQVRESAIVQGVSDLAPPAPDPLVALQSFLSTTPFPQVFDDLAPSPVTGPPPEQVPVPQEVVERVSASTVKVETTGCGAGAAGSGWAVADGTVVTNAHVVAGAETVRVLRPDGQRLDAVVVAFDDDRDVALLRVDGLGQQPLALDAPQEGADGATLGHPGGQDQLRVAPARVEQLIDATGRDIYGEDRTTRRVVVLAASLQQGDSGSPLVDTDGEVVGVVFAISPDRPGTAYALAPEEVRAVLDGPRDPGNTGRCQ